MKYTIILLLIIFSNFFVLGQLPMERTQNHSSIEDIHLHMEGIFSQERKDNLAKSISIILEEETCQFEEIQLSIQIESNYRITITGFGDEQSYLESRLRNVISKYDWEYLHEMMTAEILISIGISN